MMASSEKIKVPYLITLEPPYVTLFFLVVSVVVFGIIVFLGMPIFIPSSQDLIAYGGIYSFQDLKSEWWRLLSAIFIHGGLFHLIGNMISLVYIGLLLECRIGHVLFFVAYLASGVVGNFVSFRAHMHEGIVSVGASGAIYGLFGVLIAILFPKLVRDLDEDFMTKNDHLMASIGGFIGWCFFKDFFSLLQYDIQKIDLEAHVGGFFAGIAIGCIIYLFRKYRKIIFKKYHS